MIFLTYYYWNETTQKIKKSLKKNINFKKLTIKYAG